MDNFITLLNWVFKDFWHFIGVLLLLEVLAKILSGRR